MTGVPELVSERGLVAPGAALVSGSEIGTGHVKVVSSSGRGRMQTLCMPYLSKVWVHLYVSIDRERVKKEKGERDVSCSLFLVMALLSNLKICT